MATFTSSLPDSILEQLSKAAKELKLPKNKIIEKALKIYLEQLDKAAFVKSYKKMANDPDMVAMAEEGIEDWFRMIEEYERE